MGGALLLGYGSVAMGAEEKTRDANIVITNGTKGPLACRLRTDATVWTGHQTIAADYALIWPAPAGVRSYLECSPPASATVYEIVAGRRYILMTDKARPGVELRVMAPPGK
jgi:hypothetical protein